MKVFQTPIEVELCVDLHGLVHMLELALEKHRIKAPLCARIPHTQLCQEPSKARYYDTIPRRWPCCARLIGRASMHISSEEIDRTCLVKANMVEEVKWKI
jgi:hypothetical protein